MSHSKYHQNFRQICSLRIKADKHPSRTQLWNNCSRYQQKPSSNYNHPMNRAAYAVFTQKPKRRNSSVQESHQTNKSPAATASKRPSSPGEIAILTFPANHHPQNALRHPLRKANGTHNCAPAARVSGQSLSDDASWLPPFRSCFSPFHLWTEHTKSSINDRIATSISKPACLCVCVFVVPPPYTHIHRAIMICNWAEKASDFAKSENLSPFPRTENKAPTEKKREIPVAHPPPDARAPFPK